MSATAQRDALSLQAACGTLAIYRTTARLLSPAEARVAIARHTAGRRRAAEVRSIHRRGWLDSVAARCSTLDLASAAWLGRPTPPLDWTAVSRIRGILADEGIDGALVVADTAEHVTAWVARRDRLQAEAFAGLEAALEVERRWRTARRVAAGRGSFADDAALRCATLDLDS